MLAGQQGVWERNEVDMRSPSTGAVLTRIGLLAIMMAGCKSGTVDAHPGDTVVTAADVADSDVCSGCEPILCGATPTQPSHTGEGTYYTEADGSGNCSFVATPQNLLVAAMNHTDYNDAALCGACIELSGPKGTVEVRIVDRCPECKSGDVDLSPQAFDQVADRAAGRVPISWRLVPCVVAGPIRYHFKDGSNQWWTAVQVRNHRHPIARFEVLGSSGAFEVVQRTSYNYFVDASGMGPGPYTFRVTDIYGQMITDSGIVHKENSEVSSSSQFPPCSE